MISTVTTSDRDPEATGASGMGRAIIRSIMVAMPVCVVGLTVAIWLLTDLGWIDSFVTAILPGVSLGGFAGLIATAD